LLWLVATEEAGIVRLVEGLPASAQNLESCTAPACLISKQGRGMACGELNINKER
jgi:hypothetical protein